MAPSKIAVEALPKDAASAAAWAAALPSHEALSVLRGVWEQLASCDRLPGCVIPLGLALNALLLDASRSAEFGTAHNIALLFDICDSILSKEPRGSPEHPSSTSKNPLPLVKSLNNLILPHAEGQQSFVACGGLARMAALAAQLNADRFDDAAGVAIRMLHRLCGINRAARAAAQRDVDLRRHVAGLASVMAAQLSEAAASSSSATDAAASAPASSLSGPAAVLYDNLQSLLRLLYALRMDSAPPVPTLDSIRESKEAKDSAGSAAAGASGEEREGAAAAGADGGAAVATASAAAGGAAGSTASAPGSASDDTAPAAVSGVDAEAGISAAVVQALRVEASMEAARRIEPCPLSASAAERGLTVDVANLLFVAPLEWVGVVVSDDGCARYLGDWVVSLARGLGARGSMPPPAVASNLVVALTVALKAVAARPETGPLLLRQLTTETEVTGAAAATEVAGAGAAAAGGAGAASAPLAAAAAAHLRSSPASRPAHTVNLLQTMDESIKAVADELFWVLTNGNVATLTAAVSFPLAAGILQAKGALQLPPGM